MMTSSAATRPHRLGVTHMAATGAAALVFLFVLFWASAAFGGLPHLRALFGPMGAGSPTAVLIGLLYALVGGALIGAIVAVSYNIFRFLGAVQSVERG
jgi:hypothetical protein